MNKNKSQIANNFNLKLRNVNHNSENFLTNKTYAILYFVLNFQNWVEKTNLYVISSFIAWKNKALYSFHLINRNRMIQRFLYRYGFILQSKKKQDIKKGITLATCFEIEINKIFTTFAILITMIWNETTPKILRKISKVLSD